MSSVRATFLSFSFFLLFFFEATSKPFWHSWEMLSVTVQGHRRCLILKKKKCRNSLGEKHGRSNEPTFWLCKAQDYKKIFIYSKRFSVNMVSMLVFRKHSHIINTGNIGIGKRHEMNILGFSDVARNHRNQRESGLKITKKKKHPNLTITIY